ncbi:HNH endonuclease [Clostridium brassicae]|uniref:Putative HNH nuclease YajD n=1 Tax=Clostridium brassicae TaxID=2999072 RepID=A0ABT4D8G0_9CLOT|nr:HNH endonuclease [Clostridium brassicae]MCY6957948.1 HNH endonuclease [Clostridium brassicae]
MALKKICKCGKLIPQEVKLCEECAKKYQENKKESNRHYDTHVRDRESITFYHGKEWSFTRESIKNRDNGLCRLCLSDKTIKPMHTVHHIEELKDNWSKRLNKNNLISVCDKCHKVIHAEYKKGNSNKIAMQKRLKKIIEGEGEVEKF